MILYSEKNCVNIKMSEAADVGENMLCFEKNLDTNNGGESDVAVRLIPVR